jgi:hypothetical protein
MPEAKNFRSLKNTIIKFHVLYELKHFLSSQQALKDFIHAAHVFHRNAKYSFINIFNGLIVQISYCQFCMPL